MSLIIPANTLASGGYAVDNSCRFNNGSSDYLNRTPSSSGNRKTFTVSFWVKLAETSFKYITGATDGTNYIQMGTTSSATIRVFNRSGSTTTVNVATNAVFRDPSAWYHVVFACDTTQGTAANRIKIYINGTEATYATTTYPDQNLDLNYNQASVSQGVGARGDGDGGPFNGYLSEYVFIDGQQLTPTSFGEFDEDNGIWKPIDGLADDLTFGTNGFYLEFKESGTGTNASGMGADTSGNDNHYAVNNLTAIDQTTDTPTNNFATMNPLASPRFSATAPAFSDGNTTVTYPATSAADSYNPVSGTIGMTTGKWYWEVKMISGSTSAFIGMMAQEPTAATGDVFLGGIDNQFSWQSGSGTVKKNNSNLVTLSTYADGDIISFAYDADNNLIYFYKNGTVQNSGTGLAVVTASSTPLGAWFPAWSTWDKVTKVVSTNFGNPPYAISSGNTDGDGYGNFEYAVPSGYYSLNTKNLSEALS